MPRFAANLGYLFADRPLLERFGAAAAAGFKVVELQFPYEQPASAVRREIERRIDAQHGQPVPLDLARENGIAILIEPINRRDRPDYLLHLPEQAAACMAQIDRPNVRMQFDFYHVQIEAGDLMTRFARHYAVIGHIQIAAVPSRTEPDEGEVNYPAIFDMLDRSGYAGFVGCEYKPRRRTEDGLGWAKRYGIGAG